MCNKPELAPARFLLRVRQLVLLVEGDANELAIGVYGRVAVVLYVARGGGVNGVVAPAEGIFACVPDGAALLKNDVAGDDELVCWKTSENGSAVILHHAFFDAKR